MSSGMLTAHCHQRASHSPRVAPPNDSSGARISTAGVSAVVAALESAGVSVVAAAALVSTTVPALDSVTGSEIAVLDSVTVSGVVALLDSATAKPARSDADSPAANRMRARRHRWRRPWPTPSLPGGRSVGHGSPVGRVGHADEVAARRGGLTASTVLLRTRSQHQRVGVSFGPAERHDERAVPAEAALFASAGLTGTGSRS